MSKKIGGREYQIPLYFVPITAILITLIAASSGCLELKSAYVSDSVLTDGWEEDTSLRNSGSQFLGLEKWADATYEISGNYPATLTVTTIKTLVLMDESQLQQKTKETINTTLKESTSLNKSSEVTGERYLLKAHKTMYVIYNGIDNTDNSYEKVKIIGEIWNCATCGTSVICIGVAYLTNNKDNSSSENTENWEKIIMGPDGIIEGSTGENGLIYNVICH